MTEIKGRIIRLLDNRTVIVNLGAKDGIRKGVVFSILGNPELVVDPVTQQVLGELVIVKDKITANQVEEKFTIARKPETVTTGLVNYALLGLGSVQQHEQQPLNVDKKDVRPWKALSEEPIKVGDEVVADIADKEETKPHSTTAKLVGLDIDSAASGDEPGEGLTDSSDTRG